MATNAEQIQSDLLLCNVTMWEPSPVEEVQLNISALTIAEANMDTKITAVTNCANALLDIEDIATGDSGIDDVQFVKEPSNNSPYAWSLIPRDNGSLSYFANVTNSFYRDYIVPAVDIADVPLQHDLGEGLVDKSEATLSRERNAFLSTTPLNVIDTTIVALGNMKAILTAKRVNLEATYV